MNFKLLFICLVAVSAVYSVILDVVRYFSAKNPTPENLSDVYDAETYEKWKKYSAAHCGLDIAMGLISGAISISLLCSNAYVWFASLFGAGHFLQGLAIVVLETAVVAVTSLVRSYIRVMVIEQKYGFNRSSVGTFVFDYIRSIALEFILSFAIVMSVWLLHSYLGTLMIPILAAVIFGFILLFSFLYPILSRIGNKFVPLEEGELRDRLMGLLTKHGYKVKAIEVMDASRRTTKLNAYFTGFGKMKTIVLYDNLVNSMSTEEICAVFAHELGHGLNRDVLKNQLMSVINVLVIAATAWLVVYNETVFTDFGFSGINYGFAYVLMGAVLGIFMAFFGIFINARSRKAEYKADKQAVIEGYGEALIEALKKLGKENFENLSPSRLNVVMEYSHPPLSERVDRIEKEKKLQ